MGEFKWRWYLKYVYSLFVACHHIKMLSLFQWMISPFCTLSLPRFNELNEYNLKLFYQIIPYPKAIYFFYSIHIIMFFFFLLPPPFYRVRFIGLFVLCCVI